MSSASVIDLYERLASAPDEKSRARIIAQAFEQLEERYPQITDLATASDLRETELRLRKEIEQLRKEIEEIHKEIEEIRQEIAQIRAETQREIGQVRVEIEKLRAEVHREISHAKVDIIKWVSALLIAQFGAILWAILRFAAH